MSTVIRGRARPSSSTVQPGQPPSASTLGETGGSPVLGWAQKKVIQTIVKQTFAYELTQGIITVEEAKGYTDVSVPLIEELVRHLLAEIELKKATFGEKFEKALNKAVEEKNYDFDLELWDEDFQTKLTDFQDYEVVFFRNRTTAFTLPKPCPNCGQKKLVAEGQVFTRSADEAASQFATCKNCSSRFRLQSVL